MLPRIQDSSHWARFGRVLSFGLLFAASGLVLAAAAALAPAGRAQQPPPSAIGRIDGIDVTVEGGTAASGNSATSAPSIYVSNGSVVTVHSGTAQLTLAAGGHLDICGPAKFTLLQSGSAITLALSFGRIRVELPASTALRIFTPSVIATPLDIGGATRDVTIGLDVHDSLCVLASSGALRLENQFSGENVVVPQLGEFFLESGRLAPVVGTPGTCQCTSLEAKKAAPAPPPPPIPAPSAAPLPLAPVMDAKSAPAAAPDPKSDSKSANTSSASKPALKTPPPPMPSVSVEFSVPANANQAHPLRPEDQKRAAELAPPPEYRPEYKVMVPPLTFSAASPAPPPAPSLDTILLVRIARVQPAWEFTGKVEAPTLEGKSKRKASTVASTTNEAASAAGSASPAASPQPTGVSSANAAPGATSASAGLASAQSQPSSAANPAAPSKAAKQKSGGFWSKLKHVFGGSTVEAAPKPCQGSGCQ